MAAPVTGGTHLQVLPSIAVNAPELKWCQFLTVLPTAPKWLGRVLIGRKRPMSAYHILQAFELAHPPNPCLDHAQIVRT